MVNRFISGLAAPLVCAAPGLALAQPSDGYYGTHMWGVGWHGWFFGLIMMIVFVAAVAVVVVLLARWLGGAGHGAPAGKTPEDILKERFAKGEIDKEEFEERRRVLGA